MKQNIDYGWTDSSIEMKLCHNPTYCINKMLANLPFFVIIPRIKRLVKHLNNMFHETLREIE